MPLTIIDGVSASGKSIALKEIQKALLEERLNFTKLILTEHLTERFFEDKKPTVSTVSAHVVDILKLVEKIFSIQKNSRFNGNNKVVTVFIERLFLTLMSRELIEESFFSDNEALLTGLDIHHVLLVVPDEHFKNRLESTLERRNKHWTDFINGLGGLNSAIYYFKSQQDQMIKANGSLSKYMRVSLIEIPDVDDIPLKQIL